MQFDTKIAVVIRTDLEPWQKLNVASFLAGGIAAAFPECIGEPYGDASGPEYLALIGPPPPPPRRRRLAAALPDGTGGPVGGAPGPKPLSLIGQPILIYGPDRAALSRAL